MRIVDHGVTMLTMATISLGRSEGEPERDMVSLRMMGWGLVLLENSSVAVVAAVAAVTWGWTPKI